MTETIRCPDCGFQNPPGSASCEACNFPLVREDTAPVGGSAQTQSESAPPGDAAASSSAAVGPSLPRRPRRPRPDNTSLSLWLVFASVAAIVVIYLALKANVERAAQPVEGSSASQQQLAEEMQARLGKDSTDVEARVRLGNVYYDTKNWEQAALQYRSALAHDSTRTTALVDLGVCYFNSGNSDDAERVFLLAIARDPHLPQAMFNLGVVYESRKDYDHALQFYHRALESGPPEEYKQNITEAMQRVMKAAGKSAPPLPQGEGGMPPPSGADGKPH